MGELVEIRPRRTALLGHAFKYSSEPSGSTGVYPYELVWEDSEGVRKTVDAVVKAKPSEEAVLAVYAGLLSRSGIHLKEPLRDVLRASDYSSPNCKEAMIFRDHAAQLSPFLPRSLGVFIDEQSQYVVRIEEQLPQGSVILDPDDDTDERWREGFLELATEQLAVVDSRLPAKTPGLDKVHYVHTHTAEVMLQGLELWRGFYAFLVRDYPELVAGHRGLRHRRLLETLGDWYAEAERQPMSLIYGDVNPQNLAFTREASGGWTLNLFDWERAVVSLPQRDLAELIVYTQPPDCSAASVADMVERYRSKLKSGAHEGLSFELGLEWMIGDLLINRLPLMIVVAHVSGKRPHAPRAYLTAHRLLDLLA